jgi:outer membrane autotransporter protein
LARFITDALYLDFILRGSILRFDQQKVVPTFDAGNQFADRISDPNGWTLSGDFGLGYDYGWKQWIVNPYARLRVYHTRVDAFTESGGDGTLNLHLDEQRVTSVPLTLGATISRNFSTRFGVIAPYVRGQYLHEFNDQAAELSGFLTVLPEARFQLRPNNTDRNYGTLGAGGALTLPRGWSGFADYDVLLGFTDFMTHTVTLGVRRAF